MLASLIVYVRPFSSSLSILRRESENKIFTVFSGKKRTSKIDEDMKELIFFIAAAAVARHDVHDF